MIFCFLPFCFYILCFSFFLSFFLSSRFLICVMGRCGKDPPKTSHTLFYPFQDHSQVYEGWEKEMEKQRTDLWLQWFSFSSHDRYFLSLNFFIVWLISISIFFCLLYWGIDFIKLVVSFLYIWWKLWHLKAGNFTKTQFFEISVGFSFLF